MDLKKSVAKAKKDAMELLALRGIYESFTVKIRPQEAFDDQDTLACYKCLSQFRSRPIFWVSQELPSLVAEVMGNQSVHEVLVETLLHEYGHVIYEYAVKRRDTGLFEVIDTLHPHFKMLFVDEDESAEEHFAESFALSLSNPKLEDGYTELAKRFGALSK